ncbi:MAG TPA: glutamate racemase, partial [Terriglobales bacterium]|nr:glutamate racemase [Terriglobales bacterium]
MTESSTSVRPARPTIAVFDSGVGGLTVLRAIVDRVPNADYLYFGDTARLPYGSKSRETIARYAIGAAEFLERKGATLLVIGCNTASAMALYDVKSAVEIPVIGVIEPGADRAAEISQSREAVVIGTEATVAAHAYQRALARRGFATHEKACPLLVPLVEEGWTDHIVTEQVARIYLAEALKAASANTDVLVLGCTHYPLLKAMLRRVLPKHIEIVDSAETTAEAVVEELETSARERAAAAIAGSAEPFDRTRSRDAGIGSAQG